MALEKKYRHGAEKPPGEDREVVRRGIRIFLILLLVIGALLVGGGTIVFRMDRAEYLKELQRIESNSLDLQTTAIARELDHIMADVLFLASQNELILHLDTGDRKAVRDMEREYLHLAHSRQVYDQIRFLDASGRERVRVNSRDGQARIVSRDRLQDKSARYYFKECIALDRGGVFLSPMDLNVEAGRIEQPYRPMLRIGTPVFDTEGRKRGVVLVNYDAQNLLDRILRTGATARGVTMLLNCRGYWLISPDPNKEWGFMFPDKADETFANAYPAEWKRIVSEGKGQFRTRNGLFTFAVTDPEAELRRFSDMVRASTVPAPGGDVPAPYFWTLLSQVRPGALDAHTRELVGKLFIGNGALFLAAAFGAWFLALAVSRRQVYQEQLVAAAMFDALTGLPNRKLFFDRLDTGLAAAGRYGRKLALVYVDLDGFKGVNDSMGHEAGDEVLKRVAAILSGAVRHSDTVSRLGGDEFALILNEINEAADAAMVGEKIVSLLGAPMGLASGSASIGASVGVAVFPEHGESAEVLLRNADQAMYVSKSRGKSTCTVAEAARPAED